MVSRDDVEQLLALGHEAPSFEVKGPGFLKDNAYCARVARATMAMGNRRDGGIVCLGIGDPTIQEMLPGLTDEQFIQWSNYDHVSDAISKYSNPPVSFTITPLVLSSGSKVVVLEVHEFDDVPHVCSRDYPNVLQNGAIYVRPRGKPRSVPVPSSEDMRELLELATDKRVREFIRRLTKIGIPLETDNPKAPIDDALYAREGIDAWADATDVTEFIASRGHFDVAIRLDQFDPDRLQLSQLEALVREHVVRLRGWPVPYISPKLPLLRSTEWIGQDIAAELVPHCEAWRICRSGQFLHRRVLTTDLRDSSQLAADAPGTTGAVAVWDVLLYLVEVAEFGARLSVAFDGLPVTFVTSLHNMRGRQLISGDWSRDLPAEYVTQARAIHNVRQFEATELVANTREAGVELAQGLLRQFGADIADRVLYDWQSRVFESR